VISPGNIVLHPVTGADGEFLLSVYASTRAAEMAMVPWSAEQKDVFVREQFEAQSRHYADEHPGASHEVVFRDQVQVGRLYLARRAEGIHILDVTILPQFQKAGIGTVLLRRLLDEASAGGKSVTIYVESFNPSLGLFRKLGFAPVSENGFQLLLRWPSSG
jgi:ribosomal protein S18 acetylase RimI-like enzyme